MSNVKVTQGAASPAKRAPKTRFEKMWTVIKYGLLGFFSLLFGLSMLLFQLGEESTARVNERAVSGFASRVPLAPSVTITPPACSFMDGDIRFEVGSWRDGIGDFEGNTWGCISKPIEVPPSSSGLRNSMAYYVEGRGSGARLSKLVANVNVPGSAKGVMKELERAAKTLTTMALDGKLPRAVVQAIRRGAKAEAKVKGHRVWTERIESRPGSKTEFRLRFMVEL